MVARTDADGKEIVGPVHDPSEASPDGQDFGPGDLERGRFRGPGGRLLLPQSRAGLFSPAGSPKMRSAQFQPLTQFGPQREFERPRYIPKIRFRTPGKRRMWRGIGKPFGKRTCGVLKKDLRKRRKFAAQTCFLHKELITNSLLTAHGRKGEVYPQGPHLGQ
jgi:hypothetical protein